MRNSTKSLTRLLVGSRSPWSLWEFLLSQTPGGLLRITLGSSCVAGRCFADKGDRCCAIFSSFRRVARQTRWKLFKNPFQCEFLPGQAGCTALRWKWPLEPGAALMAQEQALRGFHAQGLHAPGLFTLNRMWD